MKRVVFSLLLLPALLAAKPKPSLETQALDKNIERAGGVPKFERLATFSCDFEETVKTASGPVTTRGRWHLKMHDDKGLRIREDVAGGASTVVLSTAPADERGKALLREVFWSFAPQWVRTEDRPMNILASGFLSHRLLDRMAVRGAPFFPGGDNLIFFLDSTERLIAGAAYGETPRTVSFHNFETTQGFLTLPTVRVYYDDKGKQSSMVKISNIVVNGYLEEKLFAPGEAP